MARPVQLAPGSLALVLCRLEAQEEAAAGAEEPSGRAVFRAFRRANARCFWNSRLARAASRLAFQGWLRRGVLLVHAPPASLQVLRDAWCRRALRPPRGFRIRAVGECGARTGGASRASRGHRVLAAGACAAQAPLGGRGTGERGVGGHLTAGGGVSSQDFLSRRDTEAQAPEIRLAAAWRQLQDASISQLQPVEPTGSWPKKLSTEKSDALGSPGHRDWGQETGPLPRHHGGA